MADSMTEVTPDHAQQDQTIVQLQKDGWITLQPPAEDGSVLMQLTTPTGVSHIVVMLNGDRVDARQKLGKGPADPTKGAP
jgi:hypothetical protein